MCDPDDMMLTFRQKIQLNNNEHMFFRQEVESWRNDANNQQDRRTTLEDISCIESSEDEDGDPVEDCLKKGKTLLDKGEWARAISTYNLAVARKPSARGYSARALAYLKRRKLVEAEKDCTEAINLDPRQTRAYIRRALARKLLGKCKESCDDMEMILKLDPDNEIVAMEYEAMLDYQQNNLPRSDDADGEKEKLETAMRLKQLGNDLVKKSLYKKALEKFTSAIKLNPKEPTFYANRAICRMKLKDFASAEKDCSEALELDGNYAKVYLRRARVRKCLGKLYEARQDFYSAFELTKDEKVLEELEEVERSIKGMATPKRSGGEENEKRGGFSILEKDSTGRPKIVQLNDMKPRNNEKVDAKGDKVTTEGKSSENDSQKYVQNAVDGEDNQNSINRSSSRMSNTKITFPTSTSANDDLSSKYDFREVLPLKHDSVKFAGPFIRINIKDGGFAAPEKLLDIPDELVKSCLLS